MRHTGERVELFTLLAKLLWYLISGRSHVGYLFNHNGNPIHNIGKIIYDSITVETTDMGTPPADEEVGSTNSSFTDNTDEANVEEEGFKNILDENDHNGDDIMED
jgi:hypothetical protein